MNLQTSDDAEPRAATTRADLEVYAPVAASMIGLAGQHPDGDEGREILILARELERLGRADAWAFMIDLVATRAKGVPDPLQHLVDKLDLYAAGVKDGRFKDLDDKQGADADIEKVDRAVSAIRRFIAERAIGYS